MHIIVHSSFKAIRGRFHDITAYQIISDLRNLVGDSGSVVFPVFTYCYCKKDGSGEIYHPELSPSKTGYISEVFRQSENVKRTPSPTHSFAVTGYASDFPSLFSLPLSPLGLGSPMEWFAKAPNCFILHLGTDLTSCSFLHYIENIMPQSYTDIFPWYHAGVEPEAQSIFGKHTVLQAPGCSKSFNNVLELVIDTAEANVHIEGTLCSYLLNCKSMLQVTLTKLENDPYFLLCPKGICPTCESRRKTI